MRRHRIFPPQIVTGAAVVEPPIREDTEKTPTYSQVIRDMALDLQQTLTRKGRAPFVMSGLPMFEDLGAIQQNLERCLAVREEPHLRGWYDALSGTLPVYRPLFGEVSQALDWVDGIKKALDVPLPTDDNPGLGGDEVALRLAHYLGQLADLSDLSSWLVALRQKLFNRSERYWSGLFPCYDIVGLPATNNDHESLFGQTKRKLRRQRGVSELREPLLRHGAWAILQLDVDTPAELHERLAQVSWEEYANERIRYERRQEQFRRRYRWRHYRDTVLEQRIADWVRAVPDC
jgi:hypothetical protein